MSLKDSTMKLEEIAKLDQAINNVAPTSCRLKLGRSQDVRPSRKKQKRCDKFKETIKTNCGSLNFVKGPMNISSSAGFSTLNVFKEFISSSSSWVAEDAAEGGDSLRGSGACVRSMQEAKKRITCR